MKKTVIVFVLSIFCATAINAQTPATTAPAGQEAKPKMTKEEREKQKLKEEENFNAAVKELGLTETQAQQLKEINSEAKKKRADLKKEESLSEEDKKAKGKEISTEANNKIKELIGADKLKQYNEIKKKQKEAQQTNQ